MPTLSNCVGCDGHLDRLAMLARQPRLGIESVDLRRPAIHEQERSPASPLAGNAAAARPAGLAGDRRIGSTATLA